ncbi:MAG: VanZ family protein [Turicibacter sp.]
MGFITSFWIELLQLFGGRFAEIDDILANSLGTFVGFIVFYYGRKIIFKK